VANPASGQSGKWKGKSKIQGATAAEHGGSRPPDPLHAGPGRHPLQRRHEARLETLTKPAEAAITVVMRKLVILANALLRDDRLWTPKPLDHRGYSNE
jgi:transposase